jgi:V8-like Glu-specific endopeptidase
MKSKTVFFIIILIMVFLFGACNIPLGEKNIEGIGIDEYEVDDDPEAREIVCYDVAKAKEVEAPRVIDFLSETNSTDSFRGMTHYAEDQLASIRRIFGSDGRRKVADTTIWPYKTVCLLTSAHPNGGGGRTTGILVGPNAVLTAGHNLYNKNRGGWNIYTYVYPGGSIYSAPLGYAKSLYFLSVRGWTRDGDYDYDYGLIVLDREIGTWVGWTGIAHFSDSKQSRVKYWTIGYPHDKGALQYEYMGGIFDFTSRVLYTKADTDEGQSGSPLISVTQMEGYVFGILSCERWYWGNEYSAAVRINKTRFNVICNWIEQAKDQL